MKILSDWISNKIESRGGWVALVIQINFKDLKSFDVSKVFVQYNTTFMLFLVQRIGLFMQCILPHPVMACWSFFMMHINIFIKMIFDKVKSCYDWITMV